MNFNISLTSELLLALMILAGAASYQFYKGRKLNLQLMDYYLRAIEEVVKPKDKDYVWLGGYIGFRAQYKIERDNLRKFEYTLTLLPRHSLLYFPISLLTSRHDKLFIVARPYSTIKREAHIIQKGYYRLRPNIENEPLLQRDEVEVNGKRYELLFEKRRDAELLREFLAGFQKVANVKHVSLTPSTNVFYVFMKPDIDTIRGDVEHVVNFVNEKLKENPFSS